MYDDVDPLDDWGADPYEHDQEPINWGDFDIDIPEESYSRSFDDDNPTSANIRWNDDALLKLLGGVGYGVMGNLLDELRDFANSSAKIAGAEYGSAVHTPENRHGTDFAPGGYVYTKNYKARLDEAKNSTLMHTMTHSRGLLASAATPHSRNLPSGYRSTEGRNGKTYYHGYNPNTGKYGFLKNPFK